MTQEMELNGTLDLAENGHEYKSKACSLLNDYSSPFSSYCTCYMKTPFIE
jgi:hypothetical protein